MNKDQVDYESIQTNTRKNSFLKKTNSDEVVEDENSTDKSLIKTILSNKNAQKDYQNNQQQQTDIVDFLHRVHNKINETIPDSQSQIMQRMSLHWPQYEINTIKSFKSEKKDCFDQMYSSNQGWITDRTGSNPELVNLKNFKTLLELKEVTEKVNPAISQEISQLLAQNSKLTEQNNSLKYNQKKTTLKIQLLNNQIRMLEKKNQQVVKSMNNYLKKAAADSLRATKKSKTQKQEESIQAVAVQSSKTQVVKKSQQITLTSSCDLAKKVGKETKSQKKQSGSSGGAPKPRRIDSYNYDSLVSDIFRPKRPLKQI